MSAPHPDPAARLTEYARLHPRGYRARVAALALLGYAFLFGALGVLALLFAGLGALAVRSWGLFIAMKAAVPLGLLAWMVGRSLWVRFHPPEGIALEPGRAPALEAEIEDVRRRMRAPPVHHLLLTDDYNAAVTQYPRLGVFGGYRVYLTLGVPLLASMPADEFRAVLAHEFGHVSRAHGRFGAWIARVSRTWHALLHALEGGRHWGRRPFLRFFNWYSPYFNAYTAVLSRANELEADRMAAEVSEGAMGRALCRMELGSRFLDRVFWPAVWSGAREAPDPPADVHEALALEVPGACGSAEAAAWIGEAMAQPTRSGDSHPALRYRLAALGAAAEPPAPFGVSAAEALLGAHAPAVQAQLSRRWRDAFAGEWAEQHARSREAAARLAELEAKAEALSDDETDERVWLTADVYGVEVAIPMARTRLSETRRNGAMHLFLGRALADDGDLAALEHLERAMELDAEAVLPACASAVALLERHGRDDEAVGFRARWTARTELLAAVDDERSPDALGPRDRFLPHGLEADAVDALVRQLPRESVRAVYLVRKEVRHLPETPFFVLALRPRLAPPWLGGGMTPGRLVDFAVRHIRLPGDFVCVALGGELQKLERPIRRVPGAELYRAPGRRPFARRGDASAPRVGLADGG